MTNIDQFESVFKAADKPQFEYAPVELRRVLVVTDLDEPGAAEFADRLRVFLKTPVDAPAVDWSVVARTEEPLTVGRLLELVGEHAPDLTCTYRHLYSTAWHWPYSLGEHLDVLTQAATPPVLVLPHPERVDGRDFSREARSVMAITDHLAGDARLVNYAARFTAPGGKLWLTHVEDETTFERYIAAIEKIPGIDTDLAREELHRQLLKEPHDYIASCRTGLEAAGVELEVAEIVTVGHHLTDYRRLVDEHDVDLLVMNTKDEDQLAMHGLAYPLAVELREAPLLML